MKIVEVLLRNGAEWTISDGDDLLPEDYAGVNGDGKTQEFKCLCEEVELEREEEELERSKKHEVQKELEKSKKLGEDDHHTRQRKRFLPVFCP
jgi:ATP-dependent Clp protease ATP-binding subunit ClpB